MYVIMEALYPIMRQTPARVWRSKCCENTLDLEINKHAHLLDLESQINCDYFFPSYKNQVQFIFIKVSN